MPAPIDPSTLSCVVLTNAAADMEQVLAAAPLLGGSGFEPPNDLARNREEIRSQHSLAAFFATRIWLNQFRKFKTFNRIGTSYALKHVAECDVGYITNGVFIAAALAEGFRVSQVGFTRNAYLNISRAAWGRGWRCGDQESFFDKSYAQRLADSRTNPYPTQHKVE